MIKIFNIILPADVLVLISWVMLTKLVLFASKNVCNSAKLTNGRLEDVKKVTKYHYNAPLTIAVGFVAAEAYVRQSDGKNFGIVDASIAATQLWLRAADMGLGAVWVSDYDTEALNKMFPEFAPAEIVVLMQIGRPAEDSRPIAWHTKKRPAAELFATL